jgi:release factor glutamine methyltransferase
MDGTTVDQALLQGTTALRAAGIEGPGREARMLLAHALGCSAADLLRDRSVTVDTGRFDTLLARRAGHEPMAFILGVQGFWSLDFLVSAATLIPRADSEALVEAALALPPPDTVLDLGTGTGCLLLAILHERPAAFGVGIDLAPDAARLARTNALRLGLDGRAAFCCGDWAAALRGRFDLVVSNPPYIEASVIGTLMPEVAEHEPRRALDGGIDGLDAYRAIVATLPDLLTPLGAAVLELGIGQGEAVASLGAAAGFVASFHPDLAGVDRAIVLRHATGPK